MAGLIKQLLDPVAMVWLVFIGFTIWHHYNGQRRLMLINGVVVFLMFLVGSTTVSFSLMSTLEQSYYNQDLDSNHSVDVIVVLGGFTEGEHKELVGLDSISSFDRILLGVELARRGNARQLYLGGGSVESVTGEMVSDITVIEPWVERWNLVDIPIKSLGRCANTYEEAMATRKLLDEFGWEKVILVTSAWHMPRAEAVFRSAGVNVIPFACDFRSVPRLPQKLVPQIERLDLAGIFLREKIGWFWYRLRGWIRLEALEEK